MARTLTIPPHLSIEELERRYRMASDPIARGHWQTVWLLARGQPTAVVADVTSYSVNWVRELARRYREDGPDGLGDRRPTNPGATPLLDVGQQDQLWAALAAPPPDGGLWTGRKVAAWMSAQLGRAVSEQRGWEYVRKLGFTPQRPRPRATRADPDTQAAFKKGASKARSMP